MQTCLPKKAGSSKSMAVLLIGVGTQAMKDTNYHMREDRILNLLQGRGFNVMM